MSHYNIIFETSPETITERNHQIIAKHRLNLNNKRRHEFSSADHEMEAHSTRKEQEEQAMEAQIMNPPIIRKKTPLIKTPSPNGRKIFDSADYFQGKYEEQDLSNFLYAEN